MTIGETCGPDQGQERNMEKKRHNVASETRSEDIRCKTMHIYFSAKKAIKKDLDRQENEGMIRLLPP